MKKLLCIFFVLIFLNCQFEQPTQFSEEALNSELISLSNQKTTFKDVIQQHKGKKILIDVWASWCADCVRGFPTVKQLQNKYPQVTFLFLSVDKNKNSWKRGISRFKINGKHFLVNNDFDAEFSEFLNLSWIPRYVVVDENGNITLFKATKATDDKIIKALEKAKSL